MKCGVYGLPDRELAEIPTGSIQISPLIPGAEAPEMAEPASFDRFIVLAPPGTVERRHVLALALLALKPGGELLALAPKDKGGARLAGELRGFGCDVEESARRHHRICQCLRPATAIDLEMAIAEGAQQHVEQLGLWTQPGVFSWNRLDPASVLLGQYLPQLAGDGADFGSGIGVLALRVLGAAKVKSLLMIEMDRRALEASRRNVADPRASFRWADVRALGPQPTGLDFIVMNPPFHDAGHEDQSLGQDFIRQAAARLRHSGILAMVANRHLPYEAVLKPLFRRVTLVHEAAGYKLFEAQK